VSYGTVQGMHVRWLAERATTSEPPTMPQQMPLTAAN
jgi:hypothetical protein